MGLGGLDPLPSPIGMTLQPTPANKSLYALPNMRAEIVEVLLIAVQCCPISKMVLPLFIRWFFFLQKLFSL